MRRIPDTFFAFAGGFRNCRFWSRFALPFFLFSFLDVRKTFFVIRCFGSPAVVFGGCQARYAFLSVTVTLPSPGSFFPLPFRISTQLTLIFTWGICLALPFDGPLFRELRPNLTGPFLFVGALSVVSFCEIIVFWALVVFSPATSRTVLCLFSASGMLCFFFVSYHLHDFGLRDRPVAFFFLLTAMVYSS